MDTQNTRSEMKSWLTNNHSVEKREALQNSNLRQKRFEKVLTSVIQSHKLSS